MKNLLLTIVSLFLAFTSVAQVGAISGPSTICTGLSGTFTDPTSGGSWTSSNTAIAAIGSGSGIAFGLSSGVATLTYTVGASFATFPVTVNPTPAAVSGSTIVCVGTSATYTCTTTGGTWTSSNPSVATIGSGGTITTVTTGTTNISYTLSTGCFSTMGVTVVTTPTTAYSVTGGGAYCSGGTGVTIGLSGSQTGVVYQLYRGTTPVGSPVSGTGSTLSFGLQTTAGTYTVTANPGTSCSGTMTGSATVSVNPLPSAYTVTGGGSYCSGGSGLPIGMANTTVGFTYQLMLGTSIVGTTVPGTGSAMSFGTFTAAGTYNAIATNTTTGCTGPMANTVTITIITAPASIVGPGNICASSSVTYTDATSGGTWTSSSTVIATVGSGSGTVTAVTTGVVTITYTISGGCYSTKTITVVSAPAAISGPTSFCNGTSVTLTDATPSGTWTSSNSSIATAGTGSGIVSGISAGVANITYTLPGGCYVTQSETVNPVPTTITGSSTVCVGSTITLTSGTGGTWSSSNTAIGTVNSSGSVTGISAGTVNISYTNSVGCSAVKPIVVNPLPVFSGSTTICIGVASTLSASPAGGTWSSSTTSVATFGSTGLLTGVSPGTSLITYSVATTGCSASVTVTVNAVPTPITGGSAVCQGSSVLLASGTGGTWSSSNPAIGSVSTSGNVTGIVAGVVTITYTNSFSCYATKTITVNPVPVITGTTSICVGSSTTLGPSVFGVWSSSSPATVSVGSGSGTITGLAVGTAIITFSISTGCLDTAQITVQSAPSPITGATSLCSGSTTTLSCPTTGGTWSCSPSTVATISTGGIVTGVGPGVATINYSVSGLCNATQTVTVFATPTIYTITGGGSYCSGGTGVVVGLSGSQVGVNYQLYNGVTMVGTTIPGSGSALSFGLQTSAGTYTVVATTSSTTCTANMSGSAVVTITTSPAIYNVTGGGSYCSGGTGVAVGLSNSQSGVSYQLYIGTIATGSPVAGTGSAISFGLQTAAGTYTVVANPGTACSGTMSGSAVVTVSTLPTVYTVTGGGTICAGSTGVYIGLSGSQTGVSYQLYNGTTPIGSLVSGTGSALSFGLQTGAGTYTVIANPGSACATTMGSGASIVVNPQPTDFALSSGAVYCAGSGGVTVALVSSTVGVSYQLYRTTTSSGTVAVGTAVAGSGGPLNLGYQTIAGTYSVIATNTSTGCSRTLTATTSLVFHAPPVVIGVAGGGTYCAGGAGLAVTMPASAVGVNYQLYRGTTPVGSSVAGIGSGISLGLQTVAGVYTVIATDVSSGCTSNMSGSATIAVSPAPAVYNMTGGGSYCSGGTGVTVGLSGSATGINYQLYRSGTIISGAVVAGTGAPISFGLQTVAGSYTAVAINTSTFCTSNMSGTATVAVGTIHIYTVTGGGSYCSGGSGVTIGLSNSDAGVNYQLRLGTTSVGSPVAGTGSAISFGTQTTAGTYTVYAVSTPSGCTGTMSGSAVITVNPSPTAFSITGGGGYCTGGTGVVVGLSGSQIGVSYQLYSGGAPVGAMVSGTGGAISFGLKTAAGIYTCVGTSTSGCFTTMSGGATVSINPLPAIYSITGGGTYCTGGSGVTIGLSGSQTGVNYQLMRGTVLVGAAVAGSGSTISFGLQTVTGTYTVKATNATTGCTSNMTGSATIATNPAPTICAMTGGGGYCSGGAGVAVGLGASVGGVYYQLYRGTTPVGSPVAGGSTLTFGLQTVAGTYTAVATNSFGCTSTMSGSATVTVYALPAAYTVTGGGSFCTGGTGVHVGLSSSVTGNSYKLYRGTTPVSSAIPGTGAALDFGLYATAGTYTVIATNSVSGCTSNMTGSATITINPNPTISGTYFTVAPAGTRTLIGSPAGGMWNSSAPSIAAIGATSGIVSGVSLGTTTITYTLSTGCFATHAMAVTPTGFRSSPAANSAMASSSFEGADIIIAPNPSNGVFVIRGKLNTQNSAPEDIILSMKITNITGKIIYNNTLNATNGELNEQFQLRDLLTSGIYFINLSTDTESKVYRLVVE